MFWVSFPSSVTGSLHDVGKKPLYFVTSRFSHSPKRDGDTKETDKFIKSRKLLCYVCAEDTGVSVLVDQRPLI